MNKFILVALIAIFAVAAAIMPARGGPRGFRFPREFLTKKRVDADEEDDEESDFWMALAPLAINLIKNKLSKKRDAVDEDDEESDMSFLDRVRRQFGIDPSQRVYNYDSEDEEEADAEFFKNLLKKVGGIALQAGKAYVGSKYGIQLDDEEEADSEFLGKVLKKVGKVALTVGKMYARTQGIPLDDEESEFINWKKIGEVAKNVGKSYLSSKYGINLDNEDEEEESDSEAGALTVAQLQAIMPTLSSSKANEMIGYLNSALNEFSINTCSRRSAFLAQLAHESGQLRWFEEFASGAAYEGRKDLGNTHPGDGKRYKGRGPIQLTGRANYRSAGQALHLDLEGNPTQAATPQVGFRIAGWFWSTRSLNSLADQHSQASFDQITRRINGGTNGKADRDHFYAKAKQVLGC